MARFVRAFSPLLPVLLLALAAPPSIIVASERQSDGRNAGDVVLVAADDVTPVDGRGPDDRRGVGAADFAEAVTRIRPSTPCFLPDVAGPRSPSRERAWLALHRRRAPSPDDPDRC